MKRELSRRSPPSRMAKRLFDVVVATIGLVLLSPVFILAALLVKLDSRGPVMFRQDRVGRGGRLFKIHKFRTMRDSGAAAMQVTVAGDHRITRVGRLLRASKVDELPQLLDVLVGNMSIVGPRPEVPKYVSLYPEDLKSQILSVLPGITDLASIRFRYESDILAASNDPEAEYRQTILPAKLALAAEYVRRRSFFLDLLIIGSTIAVVLSRRRLSAVAMQPPIRSDDANT